MTYKFALGMLLKCSYSHISLKKFIHSNPLIILSLSFSQSTVEAPFGGAKGGV